MLELRANPGPTGRLLRQMLAERGLLTGAARGVVNYGYGGPSNLPTLNARAGTFNKLRELELLRAKGVAMVPFSRSPMDLAAPVMGRSLHHTRGNDIIVYRTRPDGRILRPQRAHDFYTQLMKSYLNIRLNLVVEDGAVRSGTIETGTLISSSDPSKWQRTLENLLDRPSTRLGLTLERLTSLLIGRDVGMFLKSTQRPELKGLDKE
jgi:hypothetical protein